MNRVKTFWCERVARAEESLRRYTPWRGHDKCPVHGYHNARIVIGEVDYDERWEGSGRDDFDHADPRWPKTCACGYAFADADAWQHNLERIYRRVDTEEQWPARDLPPGASYDAYWLQDFGYVGPDGIGYTVVLPDGTHWHVDGRANNCTRRDDKVHKCWVREGDPKLANVTAGKQGNTCSAGAGSIATSKYHGFLRAGWLEQC